MCDAYKTTVWTLLVVAALVGAYQMYNLASVGVSSPMAYLIYFAYSMPILALVFYAIPRVRWLSVLFAAISVALTNSVAMASFLIVALLREFSGKA